MLPGVSTVRSFGERSYRHHSSVVCSKRTQLLKTLAFVYHDLIAFGQNKVCTIDGPVDEVLSQAGESYSVI